jgi:hypothetical protein
VKLVALVLACLSTLLLLAWLLYPSKEEMIYVYEKSNRPQELMRILKTSLQKNYSLELEKKYIHTLITLGERGLMKEGLAYLSKVKDRETLDKLIVHCETTNQLQDYLSLLDLGLEWTGGISYLEKRIDFLGLRGKKAEQIQDLKKHYFLTQQPKDLEKLYHLGETSYVMEALETDLQNLATKERIQLFRYYLWNDLKQKAFSMVPQNIRLESLDLELLQAALSLAHFFLEPEKILQITRRIATVSGKITDLRNLADLLNYYDQPEESLRVYSSLWNRKREVEDLNQMVDLLYDLGQTREYVARLREQVFFQLKWESVEVVYFELIQQGETASCLDFIQDLRIHFENSPQSLPEGITWQDFKLRTGQLLLDLYVHMDNPKEAVDILLTKRPQDLDLADLGFVASQKFIEPRHLPFILRYFKETGIDYYFQRVARYYVAEGQSQKARTLFKELRGPPKPDNLWEYLDLVPRKELGIEMETLAVGASVSHLEILVRYALGQENPELALKFSSALEELSPTNTLALKTLGDLYTWKGKPEKAFAYYEAYSKTQKDDVLVRYHLAEHYLKSKASKRARPHFEFVVNHLKPANLQERKFLALATLHLGRKEEALVLAHDLAYESESGIQEWTEYLSLLVKMDEFETLERELKTLPQKWKEARQLLEVRVKALLHSKRLDICAKLIENYERRFFGIHGFIQNSSRLRSDLAHSFLSTDQAYKAKLQFSMILQRLDSRKPENLEILASATRHAKGPNKALPIYLRLIQSQRASLFAIQDYFQILLEREEFPSLSTAYNSLPKNQALDPRIERYKILMLMENQENLEALKLAHREPSSASSEQVRERRIWRLEIARSLLLKGKKKMATQEWLSLEAMFQPSEPDLPYLLEIVRNLRGRHAALKIYEQAFNFREPSQSEEPIFLDYLDSLVQAGKLDQFWKESKRLPSQDPPATRLLENQFLAHLREKSLNKALLVLNRLDRRGKSAGFTELNSLMARFDLAHAFLGKGAKNKAHKLLFHVLKKSKTVKLPLALTANATWHIKGPAQALPLYKKLIDSQGLSPSLISDYLSVLVQATNSANLITVLKKARQSLPTLDQNPNFLDLYFQTLVEHKEYQEILTRFEALTTPARSQTLSTIAALALAHLGKVENLETLLIKMDDLQGSVDWDPKERISLSYSLGFILLEKGYKQASNRQFLDLIERIKPQNSKEKLMQAHALWQSQGPKAALPTFLDLLKDPPESLGFYEDAMEIFLSLREFSHLEQTYLSLPKKIQVRHRSQKIYASFLIELSRLDESLQILEHLEREVRDQKHPIDPQSPNPLTELSEILEQIGWVHEKAKRWSQALKHYQEANQYLKNSNLQESINRLTQLLEPSSGTRFHQGNQVSLRSIWTEKTSKGRRYRFSITQANHFVFNELRIEDLQRSRFEVRLGINPKLFSLKWKASSQFFLSRLPYLEYEAGIRERVTVANFGMEKHWSLKNGKRVDLELRQSRYLGKLGSVAKLNQIQASLYVPKTSSTAWFFSLSRIHRAQYNKSITDLFFENLTSIYLAKELKQDLPRGWISETRLGLTYDMARLAPTASALLSHKNGVFLEVDWGFDSFQDKSITQFEARYKMSY